MVWLQFEEIVQVSEERIHVVLGIEYDVVGGQRGHDLVVAVLKVPILPLPHRITQLVFVEVHDLPRYGGQVGPALGQQGHIFIICFSFQAIFEFEPRVPDSTGPPRLALFARFTVPR